MNSIDAKVKSLLDAIRLFYQKEIDRGVPGKDMLREVDQYLREMPTETQLPERALAPVVVQLQEAAAQYCSLGMRSILESFLELEPNVKWTRNPNYTADRIGEHFLENYAFCNVIGPGGFLETDRLMMGFLLLGPGAYYPKHFHPALEMYHPVCGEAFWSQSEGSEVIHPSGTAVYHGENVIHTMRTAEQPLLALFTWLGEIDVHAELKIAV